MWSCVDGASTTWMVRVPMRLVSLLCENDPRRSAGRLLYRTGSGWAGLNVLQKCAGPGKDITIISPRPHFLYTPLLAGSAVGTVSRDAVREPLRALVDAADAKADKASFLRADARDVHSPSGIKTRLALLFERTPAVQRCKVVENGRARRSTSTAKSSWRRRRASTGARSRTTSSSSPWARSPRRLEFLAWRTTRSF